MKHKIYGNLNSYCYEKSEKNGRVNHIQDYFMIMMNF